MAFAMQNISNPGIYLVPKKFFSQTDVGISQTLIHCSAPDLGICGHMLIFILADRSSDLPSSKCMAFCKLFIPAQCLSTYIKFNCLSCRQWKSVTFVPCGWQKEPLFGILECIFFFLNHHLFSGTWTFWGFYIFKKEWWKRVLFLQIFFLYKYFRKLGTVGLKVMKKIVVMGDHFSSVWILWTKWEAVPLSFTKRIKIIKLWGGEPTNVPCRNSL